MTNSRENDPFAVSTPAPDPRNPALTPMERKTYEFYLKHRDRPLSVVDLLARHLPRWAILSIALAAPSAAFLIVNAERSPGFSGRASDLIPWLMGGAFGMLFGIVLRDVSSIRGVLKVWPVQAAVLDYSRIERLLWGESPQAARLDEPLAAIPVEERSSTPANRPN